MHTIPAIEVQQLQQWMSALGHIPGSGTVHPGSVGLMPASLAPLATDQAGRHDLADFRGAAAFQGVAAFQGSLPSFQGNGKA